MCYFFCVHHTSVDFSKPLLVSFVDYSCVDYPVLTTLVLITLAMATCALTTLVLTTLVMIIFVLIINSFTFIIQPSIDYFCFDQAWNKLYYFESQFSYHHVDQPYAYSSYTQPNQYFGVIIMVWNWCKNVRRVFLLQKVVNAKSSKTSTAVHMFTRVV